MQVGVRYVRGRGKKPTWNKAADEIIKEIDSGIAPRVLKYAETFIEDWDHKPKFRFKKKVTAQAIRMFLEVYGPNKKYWDWTSRGTKKHKIKPKKAKALAFPSVYTPHTKPRGPSYGGPGESSGDTVFAGEVDHPGTKPRHFEEAISRWIKMTKVWKSGIENAIRRGLRQ